MDAEGWRKMIELQASTFQAIVAGSNKRQYCGLGASQYIKAGQWGSRKVLEGGDLGDRNES